MAALRSSLRHFSTTISKAKSNLRSEHDPDKALKIYNNVNKTFSSPFASRYPQHIIVKRLAKSRRFSDIESLIESHKKDPKITQESFFSTLLRSYGIAGMYDHAYRLFSEMEELGTPRTSVSFNSLLTAYNMCKKFDHVPKLFDEIPQRYGFSPDKFSYGILIKSYCELSLPESALTILKQMEEKKIEITTVSYTTIVDAFYKKGKVDEAEKIWKEMIAKGCSPDVAAYNVRIMHSHHATPKDVLALFDEMKKAGLKPDTISYNYLYTCYCKNDMWVEAKKVYEGLKENGCSPNPATFRLHIFYLCKRGNFDKAYDVFKESAERDKIPAFGTMKILVEGLVKNSKMKEAKGVCRTVKKKYPANFLNAWEKLEKELGLNNNEGSSEQKGQDAAPAAQKDTAAAAAQKDTAAAQEDAAAAQKDAAAATA